MVRVPAFKLTAQGKDITEKIAKNLISITYNSKEGDEADDMSVTLHGIHKEKPFGDTLTLALGYVGELFNYGSFTLQTLRYDYIAKTTELTATAANFSAPQKEKKSKSWKDTNLEDVARKIAQENGFGVDINENAKESVITNELQNNVSDLQFIYTLCNKKGFSCMIKDNFLIIRPQTHNDLTVDENSNLPSYNLKLQELTRLTIEEANRDNYDCVVFEYQDTDTAEIKTLQVGEGTLVYRMEIPCPKSYAEAYQEAVAKLKELQKGKTNGSLETLGRKILVDGRLKIDILDREFSIKSIAHTLSTNNYLISVEFEG